VKFEIIISKIENVLMCVEKHPFKYKREFEIVEF
jgi:hypothetical protein